MNYFARNGDLFAFMVTFNVFLSSADYFSKSFFLFEKLFQESHNLDPDHTRRFVGPGLDPNCLQMLSTD